MLMKNILFRNCIITRLLREFGYSEIFFLDFFKSLTRSVNLILHRNFLMMRQNSTAFVQMEAKSTW